MNIDDIDISRVDLDIYPLLPDMIQKIVNKIPEGYLNKTEDQFLKIYEPNKYDRHLRINLWSEFRDVVTESRGIISFSRVYGPIMSKHQFDTYVLTNLKRVAWMLIPPLNYEIQMENLLDLSMQRMEEILRLPIYKKETKKDGKTVEVLDTKVLGVITNVALKMREAVKGTPVSRNININAETRQLPSNATEIDKRIQELKKKLIGPSAPEPESK